MEQKENYLEVVKLKIEYDTTLSKVAPEDVETVKTLLDKKHAIMKQNGLLAERKINKINKKIDEYISSNANSAPKEKTSEAENK